MTLPYPYRFSFMKNSIIMKKTYVHSTTEINFQKMNPFFAFFLLLTIVSCKSDKPQLQAAIANIETPMPEYSVTEEVDIYSVWSAEDYELKLEINKLENEVYDLVISMYLKDGSHYVSPNAKRDFKGKFTVQFNESDMLKIVSDLIETPPSVEEFDPHPFVNGNVNWVRENTSYNQKLQPTVDNDFMVEGLIQFTIEPRCTLEKIPFFIKYEAGQMRVEIARC